MPRILGTVLFCAIFMGCRTKPAEPVRGTPEQMAPPLTLDSRGMAVVPLGHEPETIVVELRPGEVLVAVASQETSDVGWRLIDPVGVTWEIDLALGRDGAEVICHEARVDGEHQLQLRRTTPGPRVGVSIETHTSSSTIDQSCAKALSAWFAGTDPGQSNRIAELEKAASYASDAGRHELATASMLELASFALESDDLEGFVSRLEQALALARAGGPIFPARIQVRAGKKLAGVSVDEGIVWLRAAYEQAKSAGDPMAAANASYELGWIALKRSQAALAAGHFERALEDWGEWYPVDRAWTLIRLASARNLESRLGAAQALLEEAFEVMPPDALSVRCEAWVQLGWTHYLADDPDRAMQVYEEGLAACDGDDRYKITFFDRMGSAERLRGRFESAERLFLDALDLTQRADWSAHISVNLGHLYREMGRFDEARQWLGRAIEGFRGNNSNALAHALASLGRVEGLTGDPRAAVDRLEEALVHVDAMWTEAYKAGRLGRSTALLQDIDQTYVEWSMALATATDDRSLVARAFQRGDFARARNLVTVLGSSGGTGPPKPADLENLVARWPDGVLLLSYVLGDETSHVFMLDAHGLESFPLAGRDALEATARRWHAALQASSVKSVDRQRKALGRALADTLLEPVRERAMSTRRWVVVADGALGRVPFGALPDASGAPLLERFEIVQGPSVSALDHMTGRAVSGLPPRLVVIADPVYDTADPRCQSCVFPARAEATPWTAHERRTVPERLPAAGEEGAALAAMVSGSVDLLTGTAANRQAVLNGALQRATMIHFAAHSVIDTKHPSNSGIQLSRYDADGLPTQGLVTLDEIQNLDLQANLVVLSACRTAWNEDVRGDGLLGFAQAFLVAGASSVLVSLWDVEDRATAELMTELYRHLLHDGDSPARALREAQMTIRVLPRLQSPEYWAGWQVIEGLP